MMKLLMIICSLVISLYSTLAFAADKAMVLDISAPIGPATQEYIERGLAQANDIGAKMVILKITTTQGLESSAREINAAITASSIPVIAYVAPKIVNDGTTQVKSLNVLHETADNFPTLLKKLDGKNVSVKGKAETLSTKNISLVHLEPGWRYQLFSFITNPTIAYLLILIAIYGLFFELATPGLILPGIAGLISLILVLYAFQLMPLSYVGLALLTMGTVFIAGEFYVMSYGLLGVFGLIAFALGSIMLFDVNDPHYRVALSVIVMMSVVTLTFFTLVVGLAMRSHKRAVVTGKEALLGQEGVVLSIMNQQIIVRVNSEMWEAHSGEKLSEGQKIRVIGINGLSLHVVKWEKK